MDVVRWHPNGHYLATASDRQLRLWDLRSGACMRVLQAHTAAVRPPWWSFKLGSSLAWDLLVHASIDGLSFSHVAASGTSAEWWVQQTCVACASCDAVALQMPVTAC